MADILTNELLKKELALLTTVIKEQHEPLLRDTIRDYVDDYGFMTDDVCIPIRAAIKVIRQHYGKTEEEIIEESENEVVKSIKINKQVIILLERLREARQAHLEKNTQETIKSADITFLTFAQCACELADYLIESEKSDNKS